MVIIDDIFPLPLPLPLPHSSLKVRRQWGSKCRHKIQLAGNSLTGFCKAVMVAGACSTANARNHIRYLSKLVVGYCLQIN